MSCEVMGLGYNLQQKKYLREGEKGIKRKEIEDLRKTDGAVWPLVGSGLQIPAPA